MARGAEERKMRKMGGALVTAGAVMIVTGLALLLAPRMPWLGRLPGDIHYRGKNISVHLPLTTCLLASLVLTIVLNLILRLFRR